MDREKLLKHLEECYSSKRDMISRIPLGVQPDSLWQELLNLRRSSSTVLPLYGCNDKPYWYVTTNKMIASSEKIVSVLFENHHAGGHGFSDKRQTAAGHRGTAYRQ